MEQWENHGWLWQDKMHGETGINAIDARSHAIGILCSGFGSDPISWGSCVTHLQFVAYQPESKMGNGMGGSGEFGHNVPTDQPEMAM
jgi:hypothetical protein